MTGQWLCSLRTFAPRIATSSAAARGSAGMSFRQRSIVGSIVIVFVGRSRASSILDQDEARLHPTCVLHLGTVSKFLDVFGRFQTRRGERRPNWVLGEL